MMRTEAMEPRDSELLERWHRGDRAAGDLLMSRHHRTVLRFFELNASWAAEDLAQRTLLACIEGAHALRDVEAFRAYVLGIARRQLAQHQRELSRTRALQRFSTPQAGNTAQLTTLLARGREQVLALRALATLPRRAQTLLILYYWEDVSTADLATSYRVPPSTIRTRLARARDLLRHRLAELDVAPASAPTDEQLRQVMSSLVAARGSPHVSGLRHARGP